MVWSRRRSTVAAQRARLEWKKRLVNMVPFARPGSLCERILYELFRSQSLTRAITVTRSAHPGVLLVARLRKLEVFAFVSGAKDHSFGHGDELLQNLATMRMLKDAE